jgi:hypothetical protein
VCRVKFWLTASHSSPSFRRWLMSGVESKPESSVSVMPDPGFHRDDRQANSTCAVSRNLRIFFADCAHRAVTAGTGQGLRIWRKMPRLTNLLTLCIAFCILSTSVNKSIDACMRFACIRFRTSGRKQLIKRQPKQGGAGRMSAHACQF